SVPPAGASDPIYVRSSIAGDPLGAASFHFGGETYGTYAPIGDPLEAILRRHLSALVTHFEATLPLTRDPRRSEEERSILYNRCIELQQEAAALRASLVNLRAMRRDPLEIFADLARINWVQDGGYGRQ
ncbi:hypothetical protein BGX28_009957, partial [Mortierella sp. GBA30]